MWPTIAAYNLETEYIFFNIDTSMRAACTAANTRWRARGLILLRLINEALWAVTHAAPEQPPAPPPHASGENTKWSNCAVHSISVGGKLTEHNSRSREVIYFFQLRAASPQHKRCGSRNWLRSCIFSNTQCTIQKSAQWNLTKTSEDFNNYSYIGRVYRIFQQRICPSTSM